MELVASCPAVSGEEERPLAARKRRKRNTTAAVVTVIRIVEVLFPMVIRRIGRRITAGEIRKPDTNTFQ
jgi:hypothetical protein